MKKFLSTALTLIVLLVGSHFLVDGDFFANEGNLNTLDNLEVHFIDVGQGDSILIKKGNESMLIDAGDNGKGEIVVNYLNDQNITSLKYVIATHPHADHIGGMADVLNNFDVERIIMPNAINNTKTFENLLDTIADKGLKIREAKSGDRYELNGASFVILAPNAETYQDLNNYSVVVKLTNGNNSYLFTGDAEALSEKEIIDAYNYMIKSDVLKLGHHGSTTSTSEEFFNMVNPKYGVITVGEGNTYGHPHREIIGLLEENQIEIYRTDLHGSIISISDGENIIFKTTKD